MTVVAIQLVNIPDQFDKHVNGGDARGNFA